MEILRKIGTYGLEAQFKVGLPSSLYTLTYTDLDDNSVYTSTSSDISSGSVVTFTLDNVFLTYTGRTHAVITTDSDEVVVSTGMDIVRPYCNIDQVQSTLSLTTQEVIQIESLARKIIEAYAGPFHYKEKSKVVIGMGMDYLLIDEPIVELGAVYENGVLIHDPLNPELQTLEIGPDKVSIVSVVDEDRLEYSPVWRTRGQIPLFESGSNYTVEGKFGYLYIPLPVQEACELIIQDIATGGMKFTARGIESFDNKEYMVKFSKGMNEGTGNRIADRLLDSYRSGIVPGVL